MRKFARAKHDGYVMAFNPEMRPEWFDFFEYDGAPPEFISDLPAFLAGKTDESVTAKPKSKKNEPQFLKSADGSNTS
jgi:hypothetical protein